MRDKSLLIIIGGGVAAYKTLDLIRKIRERGARARAVLTPAACEFVTPLSVSALAGERAFLNLFDLKDESEIGHIRLAREADLIVIAPATADLLARMALGLANDLATAILLAADRPILAAPAMNWRMWTHPATQDNAARLKARGVAFAGPDDGAMACGESGPGRMAEPAEILRAAEALLRAGAKAPSVRDEGADALPLPLADRHVLVTAGPTCEPIDPVRYITNRSSGRQGYAIAAAAARAGARVTLISGPVALEPPPGVALTRVETAREMLAAVEAALPADRPADVAVFTAAVADWRPESFSPDKLKKGAADAQPTLRLVENPDIARTIGLRAAGRPRLVIGFAAETASLIDNARRKREAKGCDWIAANDVSSGSGVLGGDRNQISLVTEDGVEVWPDMAKDEAAEKLVHKAALFLQR